MFILVSYQKGSTSGISSPSRLSRFLGGSFKSQHQCQNPRSVSFFAIVCLSLLEHDIKQDVQYANPSKKLNLIECFCSFLPTGVIIDDVY